jgi:hypothetical protein
MKRSGFSRAQSLAMGTIECEFIAGIAAVKTSKLTDGYCWRSITRKNLPKQYAESGSPKAADSPKTKILYVSAALSALTVNGSNWREISGEKKRQPNLLLLHQMVFPSTLYFTNVEAGNPKPMMRRTTSNNAKSSIGATTATIMRKSHSRRAEMRG